MPTQNQPSTPLTDQTQQQATSTQDTLTQDTSTQATSTQSLFTDTITSSLLGTTSLPRLKNSYDYLYSIKDDNQQKYSALFKYFRSVYNKVFTPNLIKEILSTDTGVYILTKYLTLNIKGSTEAKLSKLVNSEEYDALLKDELKFRKSTSRFVRDSTFSEVRPLLAVFDVTQTNKMTGKLKTKKVVFVIDLVGKFEFTPHVRVGGKYKIKGSDEERYTLQQYSPILPEYQSVDHVYIIRADNFFTSNAIFNTMISYEELHEGVFDYLPEKDMDTMLKVITQTAVNGSNIYGYDELQALSGVISQMLYDKILLIKSETNTQSYRQRLDLLASKFETKKNQDPSVQYLASQSAFSKHGFDYVEYDKEIDKDALATINNEFNALISSGVLPDLKSSSDLYNIRFRKMGRGNVSGLYSDLYKTIILDTTGNIVQLYAQLLDKSNILGSTTLSSTMDFARIQDKYSDTLINIYESSDTPDPSLQRELDTLLIPEEVFATTLEYYLNLKGINTGKYQEHDDRYYKIRDITFKTCDSEQVNPLILSYFSTLIPEITQDIIDTYNQLLEPEGELSYSKTEDLGSKIGTTNLDYNEMSPEERHVSILAKKFIKSITLKYVKQLLEDTDVLYDSGLTFPNKFSLIFKHDKTKDTITDAHIINSNQFPSYQDQGYVVVSTKSMIKTEQSFYEIFYAQGVQGQVEFDKLVRNMRDMFHKS